MSDGYEILARTPPLNRVGGLGSQASTYEKFWLEEPLSLFRNTSIIPQCGTSAASRLNALTRLIILITILLFFFGFGCWWLFLLLGLLLVIVLYYLDYQTTYQPLVENYVCQRRRSNRPQQKIIVNARQIRTIVQPFIPYD